MPFRRRTHIQWDDRAGLWSPFECDFEWKDERSQVMPKQRFARWKGSTCCDARYLLDAHSEAIEQLIEDEARLTASEGRHRRRMEGIERDLKVLANTAVPPGGRFDAYTWVSMEWQQEQEARVEALEKKLAGIDGYAIDSARRLLADAGQQAQAEAEAHWRMPPKPEPVVVEGELGFFVSANMGECPGVVFVGNAHGLRCFVGRIGDRVRLTIERIDDDDA